jgi:hypothetical protein
MHDKQQHGTEHQPKFLQQMSRDLNPQCAEAQKLIEDLIHKITKENIRDT